MPASKTIKPSTLKIARDPAELGQQMRDLGMHYLDRYSVHLVAANQKPASLILMRRTEKVRGIEKGLKRMGFHAVLLDSPKREFLELIVAARRSAFELTVGLVLDFDEYSLGKALGYPENAVSSFVNKQSTGIYSYKRMLQVCGAGLLEGAKAPAHVAYLLHVPENISLSEGVVHLDPPSEKISQQYRSHILSVDRFLSSEIEAAFKMELSREVVELAAGTEVNFDGAYYTVAGKGPLIDSIRNNRDD